MPTVRLLGTRLRALAGGAEISLSGSSAGELVHALTTRGGPELTALLFDGERLSQDARILRNGRNVLLGQGLETPLEEHDRLTVYLFGSRAYPGG